MKSLSSFTEYDVVIVGGGHAGLEAAAAAASSSPRTVLITASKTDVGKLSCNPSVGGLAKSQIVCEVNSVGGLMGKLADVCAVHADILNSSRGKAVQAIRLQIDAPLFHIASIDALKQIKIIESEVSSVNLLCGRFYVNTSHTTAISSKTVVIATGTFSRAVCHLGESTLSYGRFKDCRKSCLAAIFRKYGVKLRRFKTSTPPRIKRDSVN